LKLIAKTFAGLEDVLASELRTIGAKNIQVKRRAVAFEGDLEVMYRANIWCRTALAILVEIRRFYAKSADDLYRKTREVNWTDHLLSDQTFSVHATTHSKVFHHSKFVALKVKDAIADFFRDIYGSRPNVDRDRADVRIEVHASENSVTLLLNSSGDALFKRGYRHRTGLAPMNECLAAGIVQLSGYDGSIPLIDFTCGSGTILFEAGMIAKNIAPGLLREHFGFQTWMNYKEDLFEHIMNEAEEKINRNDPVIKGFDIDRKMIQFARINKENIPDLENIRFFHSDLSEVDAIGEEGIILSLIHISEPRD